MSKAKSPAAPERRRFLGQAGALTAATFAAGAVGLEPLLGSPSSDAYAAAVSPLSGSQRRQQARKLRDDMAKENMQTTPSHVTQTPNSDDDTYADKRGSYSKGLPHNPDGTVALAAYNQMVKALSTGAQGDFNAIPMGGARKLTNPQGGLAFEMEGGDSHSFVQPPAPAFNSREEVAEIVENYWMALLRDVPFDDYALHPLANQAAADLSSFGSDFKGAKQNGVVTPQTLFRGSAQGSADGPFVSQYFWLPCFFGANPISQRINTVRSIADGGTDYVTSYNSGAGNWLAIQRGANPPAGDRFDPTPRFMRNGRDLGQWVHVDVLFQGYFQAFLVLAALGAPPDAGNPYVGNATQDGFATFGGPHIATLVCEVSTRALHAVWYQKWCVHRRLRPEAFAGRIEYNRTHPGHFDVHSSILGSSVLPLVAAHNQTINNAAGNGGGASYLLPQAFPEGSPTHPAYGAGHATVAGACATLLKAWFNQNATITSLLAANPGYRQAVVDSRGTGNASGNYPVVATADGLGLDDDTGADASSLTVGGELNKIAYNVANGRNIAGVHWRSDANASVALGEQVAIQLLKEQRTTYNENFAGFSL
ncbi:MAG TPA: vanadium-dependent haloperoxidase, partial [Pyrinomonadaceae bacterium]|nr:vanadium-dependent haloperoxidase [Pyrinomonadaceae bacterium]